MKKAILITVRMDSSRLPNKTSMKILDKSVLELVISRAKLAKNFDKVIVCTTEREVDDFIVDTAVKCGVDFFRGSLNDKLDRWKNAVEAHGIDAAVTMDADDLFCDPYLMDLGSEQIENDVDFIECAYGMVVGSFTYAFTTGALQKVCEIKGTDDTEMMWTYFKDTGLFKVAKLQNVDEIYFNDNIRLTLDYPEDFELFKTVFEAFKCDKNDVPLKDILAYLSENPEIPEINLFRQNDFLINQKNKTKLILK